MISSKQQHSGGGGYQNKKLRKKKSMEEGTPSKATNESSNDKNPTSRFDSSKDKLQLAIDSSTSSGKFKITNNLQNSTSSKPGSSSEGRVVVKELIRNLSLKPMRSSMKKNSGVGLHSMVNLTRATCSSTVKVTTNSESLDHDEPNRMSRLKLCPYKYCSMHGQKHEATLPTLKCLLSARKQPGKVQNNMNQRGKSSARKNDFIAQIYSKAQEVALQKQISEEKSQAEIEIVDVVNGVNGMMLRDHDEANQLQESYSVTSFEDYLDGNSEISMEEMEAFDKRFQYIKDEKQEELSETESETKLFSSLKSEYVDLHEAAGPYLQSKSTCKYDLKSSPEADSKLSSEDRSYERKVDDEILKIASFGYAHKEESQEITNGGAELKNSPEELLETERKKLDQVHCKEEKSMNANVTYAECYESSSHEGNYESQNGIQNSYSKDGDTSDGSENKKEFVKISTAFIGENPLAELTNTPRIKYNVTRKATTENHENTKKFNPRLPRFLPLMPESEAEVVKLKHQAVEERKASEEWMVDYALRNTLRRMAPARKRKVALLVAAFESVIQKEKNATMP